MKRIIGSLCILSLLLFITGCGGGCDSCGSGSGSYTAVTCCDGGTPW